MDTPEYIGSFGNKEFGIFYGLNYYPQGGWDDFVGWLDHRDEAIEHAKKLITQPGESGIEQWCQVVEMSSGVVIYSATSFDKKIVFENGVYLR